MELQLRHVYQGANGSDVESPAQPMTMLKMESERWRNVAFEYRWPVPTMLSQEERQYLYWLGKDVWSGNGSVLEVGPWLGGSTLCLAAGMRDGGRSGPGRLRVVDNFLWRSFMAERASLPIQPGQSFQPFFEENIAEFKDLIRSYARALPDEVIDDDPEAAEKRYAESEDVPLLDDVGGGPLEIVFIDGAKSWLGMTHLLKVCQSQLVPGHSLLVCQDFKYWGTYWVPALMARLGERVRPVHNVLAGTTVTFELASDLESSFLNTLETHVGTLSTEKTLADIEATANFLRVNGDRAGAAQVALAAVAFLSHQGAWSEACRVFAVCEAQWPAAAGDIQLERARAYLRSKDVSAVRPSLRLRLRRHLRRLKGGLQSIYQ